MLRFVVLLADSDMKKLLLIFFLWMFATLTASAQFITSVLVAPPNPTSDDSITVITSSSFNTSAYSVVNQVYIDTAAHVINIQLFKCKYSTPPAMLMTDTFKLGKFSTGSWSLNVMLFTAQYDTNTNTCGTFSMADTDNSTMIVNNPGPVTGLTDDSDQSLALYPNPANDLLHVPGEAAMQLCILTLQGETVMQVEMQGTSTVDIHHLPPGLYLYTLRSGSKTRLGKLVIAQE